VEEINAVVEDVNEKYRKKGIEKISCEKKLETAKARLKELESQLEEENDAEVISFNFDMIQTICII